MARFRRQILELDHIVVVAYPLHVRAEEEVLSQGLVLAKPVRPAVVTVGGLGIALLDLTIVGQDGGAPPRKRLLAEQVLKLGSGLVPPLRVVAGPQEHV